VPDYLFLHLSLRRGDDNRWVSLVKLLSQKDPSPEPPL
jgi:hypothetical protein